jgi:transcriptional regulator with XRE-family HTH domain
MEYQQIAEKLGVHPTTMSRWFSGQRSPSKTMMLLIQDELGWPVADQLDAFNELRDDDPTKDMYGPRFKEFLRDKHGVHDRLMDTEEAKR